MKIRFWNRKYHAIFRKISIVAIIVLVSVVGMKLLFISRAATAVLSLQPEIGTVVAPAKAVSDATVSGGKYVQFSTASIPTPPPCQKDTSYTPPSNITFTATDKGLKQVTNDIHYYTVNGYTVQQITDQLRACRNSLLTVDNNQYHEWRMTYVYNWSPQAGGVCHLTRVAVGLHVKFVTPKLAASPYIDAGAQAKWDTYLLNLAKYQQGYRDRDVQAANKMLAGINAYTNTSCATIDSAIKKYATSQLDALTTTNAAYATSTQYGKTLGAWFP